MFNGRVGAERGRIKREGKVCSPYLPPLIPFPFPHLILGRRKEGRKEQGRGRQEIGPL